MKLDFRVSMYEMYFNIAHQNYHKYIDLDKKFEKLESKGISGDEFDKTLWELDDIYIEREQAAVVYITFSGMCL